MEVEAVIFDMDGVIVDTEPHQIARQEEFLKHLGTVLPEYELLRLVGTNKKMAFQTISKYNTKFENFLEYYQAYNDYYRDRPIDFTEILNKEIVALLDCLKDKNLKLAVASSGSMDKIDKVLDQNELRKYFDVILSGDAFDQSKPHPEIYFTTADKMNTSANKCIVIEDSNYGIEAAKRAGMFTIAKEESRYPFSQDRADVIVESLSEVKRIVQEQIG